MEPALHKRHHSAGWWALVLLVSASLALILGVATATGINHVNGSTAIINGGATTTSELQRDYAASRYAQQVYNYFNITAGDISKINNTSTPGSVTKDGAVIVNNYNKTGKARIVAQAAVVAWSQNLAHSKKASMGNATFYVDSPKYSFQQDSQTAFVVMKNGTMQYAVLIGGANPVIASPIVPTSVASTSTTITTKPKAVQQLVNTGSGNLIGLFSSSVVLGTVFYHLRLKKLLAA